MNRTENGETIHANVRRCFSRASSPGLSGAGWEKEGRLTITARFTLQKIFVTARVKMVRVPKKGFGSDKICSVNNLSVPNFMSAQQTFLPVLGPSAR